MSHEKTPNQPEKKTEEIIYERFVSEIERADELSTRTATRIVFNSVASEYRDQVISSFDQIRNDIKPQILLRAEVVAMQFSERIDEINTEAKKDLDAAVRELTQPAEAQVTVLVEELTAGITKIMSKEGDPDKKLELVDVLQESVEERRKQVTDTLDAGLDEVIEKHQLEKKKKVDAVDQEMLTELRLLFVQFVDLYLERLDVLIQEFAA